jgi:hypothetical protein
MAGIPGRLVDGLPSSLPCSGEKTCHLSWTRAHIRLTCHSNSHGWEGILEGRFRCHQYFTSAFRDDSESSLFFRPSSSIGNVKEKQPWLASNQSSRAARLRLGRTRSDLSQLPFRRLGFHMGFTKQFNLILTLIWFFLRFSNSFRLHYLKGFMVKCFSFRFPFSTRGPSHTRSERTGTQRIRHTFGWYSKWGVYDSSQLQDFNPTPICLALSPRTIYIVRICTFSMLPNPSQSTQPKSWYLTGYFVFLVETPRKGSPS